MEMIPSRAFFSEYDGSITDHNGDKCTYREGRDSGWVLERDKKEPCIKTIGYYQWIPIVLLLQVIHIDLKLFLMVVKYYLICSSMYQYCKFA